MLSSRSSLPTITDGFAARAAAARHGAGFLDLTLANPTLAHLEYDAERLKGALDAGDWLAYQPDSLGRLDARTLLAEHFMRSSALRRGAAPTPQQILLTSSTSEAYSNLFKLLCDPGDSVLVPEPSYPLFAELARYDSVELVPYRLAYDGAWHLDVDSLRRSKQARTRAVIAVSPNNPTGNCLKRTELDALMQLGLPIIVDEVFAGYLHTDVEEGCSGWAAQNGLVFVLDGLSKWAGLPQAKLAWTIVQGDPHLRALALERLEFIADTYLSPNGFVQAALGGLLAAAERTHDSIHTRVCSNLAALDRLLVGSAANRLHLEGGWSSVLRLPGVLPENEWCERFLELGVGVQPGWFFDFGFEPTIVISLLPPAADFELAIGKLLAAVEVACR